MACVQSYETLLRRKKLNYYQLQPAIPLNKPFPLISGNGNMVAIYHCKYSFIPVKMLNLVEINNKLSVNPEKMFFFQYILHIFQRFGQQEPASVFHQDLCIIITGF